MPRSTPLRLALAATVLAGLAQPAAAQTASYTIIDIGDLAPPGETDGTNATGLNELGHVAAVTGDGSGPLGSIAVLYRDGQLIDLGELPNSIPGGGSKGVNNLDQVSGWSLAPYPTGGWQSEPFVWTEGQGMVNPADHLPQNINGESWDVNDAGQMVLTTNGSFWDPVDGYVQIDLGFARWKTWDLNEDGVVAGAATGSTGFLHALRYDHATGTTTDLADVTIDRISEAYGLNDLGDIVGYARQHDLGLPAMVWTADGQTLRIYGGELNPNLIEGSAEHINNHGDLVGMDEFPGPSGGNPDFQPIGWVAFGATSGPIVKQDLLELVDPAEAAVWSRLHPFEINDRGEITGIAVAAAGGPSGGARGFLMVPNTPSHWRNLGRALKGTQGHPVLLADGTLEGGTSLDVRLYKGMPSSLGYLIVGLQTLDAPFYGGVLVPDPTGPGGRLFPVVTDSTGGLAFTTGWPAGQPSGLDVYAQYWAADPAGVAGFCASNAVTQQTP